MDVGALGVLTYLDRSGANPRLHEWLAERLRLEVEIDSAGEASEVEWRTFGLQRRETRVDAGHFRLALLLATCELLGWDERGEVRGTLVLFTARKGPGRAFENPVERVVVLRRDRIVLVIVAACAADREAEQGATDRVDHVGEVEVLKRGGRTVAVALADREKARRRDEVGVLAQLAFAIGARGVVVLLRDDVAGDLLPHELVKGLVAPEGVDDPVAILACLADGVVGAVAGRVGVARNVEPVTSPALTVRARFEKTIDERRERVRGIVGEVGADLFRRRRQPGEVEGDATDQCSLVGELHRGEALAGIRRRDEGVDRMCALATSAWRVGPNDRAERPELTSGVELETRVGRFVRVRIARIESASLNPLAEMCDLRGLELLLRRHREIFVSMLDRPHEQALRRFPGHDDLPPAVTARRPTGT